jgi:ABC-2 type transport system permease protein
MLRNVFLKSLRDQRRALLGWSIGLVLLVGLESALWPSVKAMPALNELLASYPEALRTLFKLEDFASGTGFMNAELFTAMLPILFLAFGIARGARAVAGEEESGTLEVLLVTPVSTTRLVLQQAAALAAGAVALGAVLYVSALTCSAVFNLGIGAASLASAVLAMVLLGVEFGWLALALGAATGRRSVAIAGSAAAAVGFYVLYIAGEFVDAIQPWQPVSPFYQALHGGPLGGAPQPSFLWMAVAGAAVVAVALPIFDRRDIAAH